MQPRPEEKGRRKKNKPRTVTHQVCVPKKIMESPPTFNLGCILLPFPSSSEPPKPLYRSDEHFILLQVTRAAEAVLGPTCAAVLMLIPWPPTLTEAFPACQPIPSAFTVGYVLPSSSGQQTMSLSCLLYSTQHHTVKENGS